MSEKDQHASDILLAFKPFPHINITAYINVNTKDLPCLGCNMLIEEGMPIMKEVVEEGEDVFTFDWHLTCFGTQSGLFGDVWEVDHTRFQDFLNKNPDLIVLEKLRGIGP